MYKMTSTLKQIPYHQLDWLRARHGVIVPFFIFSLGVAFTTRIALLIKAARFSGLPKVLLKAKSLMGRIPSGMAAGGNG